MEALAAVGAASSIVQLVDFTLKLIASGKEIRDSVTGSSLQNEALEDVYKQMQSSLQSVENLVTSKSSQSDELGHREILSSARIAHKDCSEILSLLEKLKLKSGGHRRWDSLVAALKSMMGRKRVSEVEARLRIELASISIVLSRGIWAEVQKLTVRVDQLIAKASHNGIKDERELEQLRHSFAGLCTDARNAAAGNIPCDSDILVKDVEALHQGVRKYDLVEKMTFTRQAVINSLHFESRAQRHETIHQNHRETFSWIYNTPSFRQWAEGGVEKGGIFWIHGKPGSGKSTLMKFLANNQQTQTCLDKWARPYKATIAAHYFWNLGTDMQKSLLGLMKTLVFEILRKCPESIQSACPDRWRMAFEDRYVFLNQKKYDREGQWTMEELSETIKLIAQSQDSDTQTRLCLFVDGLDEFEGDHRKVCKLLVSLAGLPQVKLCLSSRPLNIFRDEFGGDETTQLAVHELTGTDMKRFVNDHLVSHPKWSRSNGNTMINTEDKVSLVNEIRQRANGVFLWVALVTKSICDGLTNEDSIYDLRERLRLLPTDLSDLFKHILDRIDLAHRKKSAEHLWIALHDRSKSLPAEAYYFHERDHENERYAIEWPIKHQKTNDQLASRRISALTGGLLEVSPDSQVVSFLHRTVAEFLWTKDISEEIRARVRERFDVYLALAKMSLVLFKHHSNRWLQGAGS
ncbi:hypothetical protein QBC40DRAFT_290669 [Triangularia verruculosa]|uniref:NACHT domain-containing protein n=1 Tax=Triangularia verruculosa TaxID=2587418 RepID=A0AAN6X9F1_9PEZI|nr:hypothetical protein QBC40DRAFT_290669 [Triangularia verruculosa]